MPAAAAEAPVGNHHVLAIKKYALANVISQMMRSRMRPMYRRPPDLEPFLLAVWPGRNLSFPLTNSPPNRRESIIPLCERKRVLGHLLPSPTSSVTFCSSGRIFAASFCRWSTHILH